jgi:C4-type Zn-finger protein
MDEFNGDDIQAGDNPEPCPECGADLETRVTSGFDGEMVIETYCTECAYSTVDIG